MYDNKDEKSNSSTGGNCEKGGSPFHEEQSLSEPITKEMVKKERYHLIDALRGLAILLMMAHHFVYALLYAGIDIAFGLDVRAIERSPLILGFLSPFFAGVFILLSGMSSRFSRSNVKRGIIVLVFAALLSVVGHFFGAPVWFGILHFMGLSMLTYGLLSKWLDKIPFYFSLFLWSSLFIFCFITLPRQADNNIFYWLGFFNRTSISSVDYFPFGRWFFLFLFGTRIGQLAKDHKFPKWFYRFNMPILPIIGKHTLIIYLAHQPFFFLILTAYNFIRG